MSAGGQVPPSADDIAAIGTAILAELPEPFRGLVAHVPVRIEDWPDDATLKALEIDDPLELTGLYAAVPVGDRHAFAAPRSEPELIFLFRQPILAEWCERGCTLWEVVFDVLTHEIGHHLGMDEAAVLGMEGRGGES